MNTRVKAQAHPEQAKSKLLDQLRDAPWEKLITHRHCVHAQTTLVDVRNHFRQQGVDFMVVTKGQSVLGLCSHKMVNEVLSRGHQGLGFSIYERRHIGDFLLPKDFRITTTEAVHDVLDRLSEREPKHFFDDVIVLSPSKEYLGMITAHDLMHFQHAILQEQHRQLQNNIAELRFLTEQLNESNEKLHVLNDEKNEFLGIAAHDLKNPINIISMSTELILNEEDMPKEDVKSLLGDVGKSCDRMIKLLGDLLDINRIENNKLEISLQPCDFEHVVLSLLDYYNIQAEKKSLKVHYHCEAEVPQILADESLLMQVLENLFSNAIKFSPRDKHIYVTIEHIGRRCTISIKDEGPGFTEEDKKKLFQKFARLSAKPTGNENSTGLGLSIVNRLVEQMNGTISVQSEHGKGATFTVAFPIA